MAGKIGSFIGVLSLLVNPMAIGVVGSIASIVGLGTVMVGATWLLATYVTLLTALCIALISIVWVMCRYPFVIIDWDDCLDTKNGGRWHETFTYRIFVTSPRMVSSRYSRANAGTPVPEIACTVNGQKVDTPLVSEDDGSRTWELRFPYQLKLFGVYEVRLKVSYVPVSARYRCEVSIPTRRLRMQLRLPTSATSTVSLARTRGRFDLRHERSLKPTAVGPTDSIERMFKWPPVGAAWVMTWDDKRVEGAVHGKEEGKKEGE